MNPMASLFEPAGGKVVGKTIFLGFYENETEWNREQVDRVQVRMSSRNLSHFSGDPCLVCDHVSCSVHVYSRNCWKNVPQFL